MAMVDRIYALKNQFIQRIERDIQERGLDRIDVNEMGELVDMVKDLAEAEESCWKATYYRLVSDGMQKGAVETKQARAGYDTQQRHDYTSDTISKLSEEYRNLTPDERNQMRDRILSMFGMM